MLDLVVRYWCLWFPFRPLWVLVQWIPTCCYLRCCRTMACPTILIKFAFLWLVLLLLVAKKRLLMGWL